MVKPQKRFAYSYQNKEGMKDHFKCILTVPEEITLELKWKEGVGLEPKVENHRLLVDSVSPTQRKEKNKL